MDQETLFSRHLEDLTEAISDPARIDKEKVCAILKDICILFRICKAVMVCFAGEEAEKHGKGTVHVCYDSGEEPGEELSCRTVLNSMMVANCTAFRIKGSEPWTDAERKRISMIEKLMITVVGRMRMAGLLEQAILFDEVGYSNIRYFHNALERLAASGQLSRYAALRFNLKHFALINQQLGREACDQIMKRYITAVQEAAGEDGTVSRLGGDNFVALCRKDRLEQTLGILEGLPVQYGKDGPGRVLISASTGVFSIPEDYYYHDFGDVMDRIINAYTAAKSGNAGNVVYSSEQMLEEKEKAMRIRQLFPAALQKGDVLVYYQPKINIDSNELVGAEALSRWWSRGRLMIPPEFIPILEQSMDICKLDFYVLDTVCRDIRRWLNEGRPVVRVSVNLSRRHLINLDLLESILAIIDKYSIPHKYIEIELTETTTDVEFSALKEIVTGLQKAGICTSVDDFGIGYSSLELIREIPWDILKVDKSFLPMDDQASQDRQNIMFRHLVNMANEIGLTYVAEGVETSDQIAVLRQTGCNIAQGFFYDEALPVHEFEKRLDQQYYQPSEK